MKRIISLILLITLTVSVTACGKQEVKKKLTNVFSPTLISSFEAVDIYRDSITYQNGEFYMLYHQYGTGIILRIVGIDGSVTDQLLTSDDSGNVAQNAVPDPEGNILMISYVLSDDQENGAYNLIKMDDGSICFETALEIEDIQTKLHCDAAGNSYITSGNTLICCNPSGEVLYSTKLAGNIIALGGSDVVQIAFETEAGVFLAEATMAGVQAASEAALPLPATEIERVLFGSGYRCYIDSDEMVYGLNEENTLVDILNWDNSGISQNIAANLFVISETELVYFRYNQSISKEQLIRLTKVPDDEVAEKTTITFAMIKNENGLIDLINEFNQTNGLYYIEVWDYSPANKEADSLSKLKIELAAGNAPDLVQVTERLDLYNIADKGMFADLYSFIESDAGLAVTDFIDGLLPMFEMDGGLMMMPYSFSIETMAGKTKNLGHDGWTPGEFFEYANKNSDALMLFSNRREIFERLCLSNIHVIEEQTSLHVGDGLLADILTYTKGLKEDYPIAYMDVDEHAAYDMDKYRIYREDEVLLWNNSITSYLDYMKLKGAFDNAEMTYVGYPVSEGSGTYLRCRFGIAMSSRSQNQSGAWEFMRTLLTDSFLSGMTAFPATKSGFDIYTKNAVNLHYYIDSASTVIASAYERDEAVYNELLLTDADIDQIKTLISGASLYPTDADLISVIWDEAAMYYNDARNLGKTVEIINGRLRNYFAERQ